LGVSSLARNKSSAMRSEELSMRMSRLAGALSLSGVLSLGVAAPACSAPITPLSASAKAPAQASDVIQVRFGGFRGGVGGFRGGVGGFRGGFGGFRGAGWRGGGVGWRGGVAGWRGGVGGWRSAGWRGGGWGWRGGGWGLGALAAGAVIGGALTTPYWYGAPYDAYAAYDDYDDPYSYGTTAVVAPGGWGGSPFWGGGGWGWRGGGWGGGWRGGGWGWRRGGWGW
jgi:hypothetical protein